MIFLTIFLFGAFPPYLDPKSLGILPRLSRYWHQLFSQKYPWRTSLITHLSVKKEVLDQFEKLRQEGKISFDYKQMYARYYRLNKVDKQKIFFQIAKELKVILADKSMQFSYLPVVLMMLLYFLGYQENYVFHFIC